METMETQTELFVEKFHGASTTFETRLTSCIKKDPVTFISGQYTVPAPAVPFSGQAAAILAYLQSGHSITPLEALEKFNCFRLGARAWDLKRAGYPIKTEMIEINGKHVARYSLQ